MSNEEVFEEQAFTRIKVGDRNFSDMAFASKDNLMTTIREKTKLWVSDDLSALKLWVLELGPYETSFDADVRSNDVRIIFEQRFRLRKRNWADLQYPSKEDDPCGYCGYSLFIHEEHELDHGFLKIEYKDS